MSRSLFLSLIQKAKEDNRNFLLEHETKELLLKYDIPIPNFLYCRNITEVRENINKLRFPLVMKIVSRDVLHKSDIGGVILNINSEQEAIDSYKKIEEISRKYSVKFEGVLITEQVEQGLEIVIGVKYDPIFEHVIMFGSGGILVEILKDVSFRIIPINKNDAFEIINETKIGKIIKGYRGKKYDISSLINLLLKVSYLVEENKEIKELDLNPVFLYENGIYVIDARLVF